MVWCVKAVCMKAVYGVCVKAVCGVVCEGSMLCGACEGSVWYV